jgi:hypothetical protein
MKTLSLLFVSILLTIACQSKKEVVGGNPFAESVKNVEIKPEVEENKNQNKQQNTIVEYTASTRGYFSQIIFLNNQLTVSNDRNSKDGGKLVKVSKEDLAEINKLVENIDLVEFVKLEGPTKRRQTDAAAYGNVKITKNGEEYQTLGFDAGTPPKQIEALVNKLTSFIKEK